MTRRITTNVNNCPKPPDLHDQMETCDSCGEVIEIGQWYQCPHEWVQRKRAKDLLVFIDISPSGKVSFPAQGNLSPVPEGFSRQQLTTRKEVEKFCKEIGKMEKSKHHMAKELEERTTGEWLNEERKEVLAASKGWSDRGKDLLREAIKQMEREGRSSSSSSYEANLYLEQLEYHRSNLQD